jgi:transcription elongation factor S-II
LSQRFRQQVLQAFKLTRTSLPQATKAGVYVGKLRANPNKEIARAATELVAKWKKLVEQEKAAKLGKSAAVKLGSPAMSSASPASNAAAAAAVRKPFKGDTEKRRHETEGIDIKRTESQTRNSCIGLIYNGLAYRSTDPGEEVLARAIEVEAAAFAHFKSESADYKGKIRSLFQNLKNKTNRELGRRVMTGDVTAERFVVMSHDELKSAEQRKQDDALEKENMKKAQVANPEKSISDALKCGKCGQRKVSYNQAQTRSADEPMTTFCECTVCGNRWKVNIKHPVLRCPHPCSVPHSNVAYWVSSFHKLQKLAAMAIYYRVDGPLCLIGGLNIAHKHGLISHWFITQFQAGRRMPGAVLGSYKMVGGKGGEAEWTTCLHLDMCFAHATSPDGLVFSTCSNFFVIFSE